MTKNSKIKKIKFYVLVNGLTSLWFCRWQLPVLLQDQRSRRSTNLTRIAACNYLSTNNGNLNKRRELFMACLKSGVTNNIDHMRISGTEPSSMTLSQTKSFRKMKIDNQKVPKQAEYNRDGVINPQNNNFKQWHSQRRRNSKRYFCYDGYTAKMFLYHGLLNFCFAGSCQGTRKRKTETTWMGGKTSHKEASTTTAIRVTLVIWTLSCVR